MDAVRIRTAVAVLALVAAGMSGAGVASAANRPAHGVAAAPDPAGPGALPSGATLASGAGLVSADGRYSLVMQPDGNLVALRPDGRPVWDSNTAGQAGSRLVMQPDGNAVVVSPAGGAVWDSGTSGHAGAFLVVQSDGNVVVYDGDRAVFASQDDPGRQLYEWEYTMYAYEELHPTDGRYRGQYRLLLQADGSVALYGAADTRWTSATAGYPDAVLRMQDDGNLVLYTAAGDYPSRAVWHTDTSGQGPSELQITADGGLTLTEAAGSIVWSTRDDTSIRIPPPGAALVPDAAPGAACGPRGTMGISPDGELLVCSPTASDPHGGWRPTSEPLTSTLAGGTVLAVDEQLASSPYRVIMQGDGNLVVYRDTQPVWQSGTSGHPGASAILQPDGNLVVYSGGAGTGLPLWQSGTLGTAATTLRVQSDGNLVVYRADATPVWSRERGRLVP